MSEELHIIDYGRATAKNNAECIERLMELLAQALPQVESDIVALSNKWKTIQSEIDESALKSAAENGKDRS